MPRKQSVTRTDLKEAISLVCAFRRENYAYERHLALLTIALWAIEPNDEVFVRHGRLIGAAQIVKSLKRGTGKPSINKFLDKEFSREHLATAILSLPIIGPLREDFENRIMDVNLAASVIETFLTAPESKLATKRPSLNKAIYFISKGGFGSGWIYSPATIKKQWVANAVSAPFLMADEECLNILKFVPDEKTWFTDTTKALKKVGALRDWFGIAKFIQEQLRSKLDRASLANFEFVEFPSQLASIELSYEPLTDEQQKLYRSYKSHTF